MSCSHWELHFFGLMPGFFSMHLLFLLFSSLLLAFFFLYFSFLHSFIEKTFTFSIIFLFLLSQINFSFSILTSFSDYFSFILFPFLWLFFFFELLFFLLESFHFLLFIFFYLKPVSLPVLMIFLFPSPFYSVPLLSQILISCNSTNKINFSYFNINEMLNDNNTLNLRCFKQYKFSLGGQKISQDLFV